MTNVVSLHGAKKARQQQAFAQVLAALATPLPQDPYVDEDDNTLLLLEDDWDRIGTLQATFGLPVRRDLTWEELLAMWSYLTGNLGHRISVFQANKKLFYSRFRDEDPALLRYIEALCSADIANVRKYAREVAPLAAFCQ